MNKTVNDIQQGTEKALQQQLEKALIYRQVLGRVKNNELEELIRRIRGAINAIGVTKRRKKVILPPNHTQLVDIEMKKGTRPIDIKNKLGTSEPPTKVSMLDKYHDQILESVRTGEKRCDLERELDCNKKTLYRYIRDHIRPILEAEKS